MNKYNELFKDINQQEQQETVVETIITGIMCVATIVALGAFMLVMS